MMFSTLDSGYPLPASKQSFLVTFAAPKVTKSALLQQAGPSFAGATLRYSQLAALMSRSLTVAPTLAFFGGLLRCSAA